MRFTHIACLMTVLALTSCNKEQDVNELIPSVEIISAEPTPEGTIIVTGRITNFGKGDPVMLGFCADSIGDPRIDQNQTLVYSYSNNDFTGTVYPHGAQSPDHRIFINAFAGNDVGLGKGSPLELTNLNTAYEYPQMAPPCRMDYNNFYLDGNANSFVNVSDITPNSNWAYSVTASDGEGTMMTLTFGFHESHIYTLTHENISFASQGLLKGVVTTNGETFNLVGVPRIQFSRIAHNRYVISICDAYLGSISNAIFNCQIIAET